EVYENGVKQELTSLTLVHGGRVHNLATPPPAAQEEGLILPVSRPRNDTAGRIFLIIVDDLHIAFRNTGRIRDLFKRIRKSLAHELSELTRTANRANATLYTIDPRGLVAGSDLDETLDPVEYGEHIRKTQDSLRVLAEQTGGIAVVNQNNFDKALKRIDAETS